MDFLVSETNTENKNTANTSRYDADMLAAFFADVAPPAQQQQSAEAEHTSPADFIFG